MAEKQTKQKVDKEEVLDTSTKLVLELNGVPLTPREIFRQVQQIMVVNKTRRNTFANFNFRNVEDIFAAFKATGAPLILNLSDKIVSVADRIFIEATATVEDLKGNLIKESTAQAELGAGKAGMSTEQATGSASSYARKYALNGLFLLDDAVDPDAMDQGSGGNSGGATGESNTALIKKLQELIRGNAVLTKKATDLLKGRQILKMSVKEIEEIIDSLVEKEVTPETK